MTPVATAPAISPDAIGQACRESLAAYGAYVLDHKPAAHHKVWLRDLRRIERDGGRLLLVAPPGFAKSTWATLTFITWYLGLHPDHSVLFLTSADDMATNFNTAIRSIMESERYQQVFPSERSRPDKDRGWSGNGLWLKGTPPASKDPAFRAVGFGSTVIGGRVNLVVEDDVLTQEKAQSETDQPKAAAYHDATILSRLHPEKPREVMITTRWHENDLAGHCLQQAGWESHVLPALDEHDESTWPDKFPTEYLREMRRSLGTALFRCVWQGDPTSLGGTVFREESWFRPLPSDFDRRVQGGKTKRESLSVVQFWDFAFSEKKTADWSACVTAGTNVGTMDLYVLGAFRKRIDEGDLVQAVVDQWEAHQPMAIAVEQGIWDKYQVVKEIVRMARKQVPVPVWTIPARGDKMHRAMVPAARGEAGQLFCDKEAPGVRELIAQCLGFPLAANDDDVDALSGAAELLATKISLLYSLQPKQRQFYSIGQRQTKPTPSPVSWGRTA